MKFEKKFKSFLFKFWVDETYSGMIKLFKNEKLIIDMEFGVSTYTYFIFGICIDDGWDSGIEFKFYLLKKSFNVRFFW